MNNTPITLLDVIYAPATQDLRTFLNYRHEFLAPEYLQELHAPAPTNAQERRQAVHKWAHRWAIIKRALANFPTLRRGSAPRNNTPQAMGQARPSTPRNPGATSACLRRDGYQCVITGRRSEHGFALEVAHIIPYALANDNSCRGLDFWNMLELFWGVDKTNRAFARVRNDINSTANLVTLDNSIHSMFDNGSLTLTPIEPSGILPIRNVNNYSVDY